MKCCGDRHLLQIISVKSNIRSLPLSFFQVNPVQTEKLYGLALEYADLKGDETVLGSLLVESERYPCFWRRMRNKSTVWRSFLRPSRTPEKTAQINGIDECKVLCWKSRRGSAGILCGVMPRHIRENRPTLT